MSALCVRVIALPLMRGSRIARKIVIQFPGKIYEERNFGVMLLKNCNWFCCKLKTLKEAIFFVPHIVIIRLGNYDTNRNVEVKLVSNTGLICV